MKRTLSKSLTWLLTLLMLLTALPVNGLSEALVSPAPTTEATPVPAEDEGAVSATPAPAEDAQTDEGDEPEETPADVVTLRLTEENGQLPVRDGAALYAVRPEDRTKYRTYRFYAEEKLQTLLSEQIVKEGDTLYEPKVTAGTHQKFIGWSRNVAFGKVGAIETTETINVYAQFEEVYYVFFKDNNGRVIKTVEGKTGDVISAAGVSFPVSSDESITGWKGSGYDIPADGSVTIADDDITLTAVVTKGHWITFDSKGGTYVAPQFVTGATQKPADPTRAGYTFEGWQLNGSAFTFGGTLTDNIALEAAWTAKADTRYTVIHWQENANDDEYSFKESETKTGTTGEQTNARAKSYQGFTAQTVEQKTIAGDGSTIVNVYYKRNVYEVKFYSRKWQQGYWGGQYVQGTEYTDLRITAKYGASIGNQWPTVGESNTWAVGVNEKTYQVNIDTMPLNGATFYGPKTGNGSETAYYYVEVLPGESGTNHNGVTYKPHHSDTTPGTGYLVTEEDKYPITGFTYKEGTPNHSDYNNAKFYYTRNSYVIKFMNNGTADKTVDKKFEQSIADESYTPKAPAGKEDYTFGGWYENELCEGTAYDFTGKTMPAKNITLFAKWNAPTYTVTFYDADGKQVGDPLTVPKGEEISTDNAPAETALNLKEGESFLGWVIGSTEGTPFNFDTKINKNYDLYAKVGDGNEYTVTYDANGGTGTVTDATKYSKDAYADVKSEAGLTAPTGKVFLGWSTDDKAAAADYHPGEKVSMAGGNVTLYAVWGDQAQTVELTYHANGGNGDDIKETHPNNTLVTLRGKNAFTRTGYTLTGWNTKADGTGNAFGLDGKARVDDLEPSNDLYAVWTPNADTAYKVEFYYQNDDQNGYTLNHTDTRKGVTDTTAAVTDADKADKENGKYAYDASASNVESGNINGDGSLVLKLYFKLNQFSLTIHYVYEDGSEAKPDHTAVLTVGHSYNVASPEIDGYTVDKTTVSGTMPASDVAVTVTYTKRSDLTYTVNYYWNGTTETVAESKTVDGQTFGAVATESPIAVTGYTAVSSENKEVTIAVEGNVINFYYYKNVKLIANSKNETYNGTEQGVSGFTGAPEDADFSAITVDEKRTDAGEYAVKFPEGTVDTVDKSGKYIVKTTEDGKLVIKKRAVTFTGESDEKVYNATEQELTGIAADNLVTGHKYDGLTYSAKGTNAGEYNGAFSGDLVIKDAQGNDVTANYEVTKTPGKLTITKAAQLVVKVTGNTDTLSYNGKTQSVEGFTHDAPDDVTVSLKEGKAAKAEGMDVGTYPMGLKAEDFTATSNNYDTIAIEVADGWLKIDPISIEGNVTLATRDVEKMYDGQTYAAGKATAADRLGDSDKLTIEYSVDGENWTTDNETITAKDVADSKTVQVRVSGSNYTGYVTGTEKLTINPREVTLTSASDEKVYDGTPLTNRAVTVGGDKFAADEGAAFNVTGAQTDVDESDNTFGYTLNEGTDERNYAITKTEGKLKVTPVTDQVTVTITEHSGKVTYDGKEHTVTGYDVTAISNKLYTADNFTFSGEATVKGTDVGVYGMELKPTDFKNTSANFTNVVFIIVDGKLEIAKRTVILTSASAEKVYDGTPLTNSTVKVTGDGFADGEGAAITVTGTQTDVDKSANTFEYKLNEGTKAGNYSFKKETGMLEVTPVTAEVVVKIKGNKATYEYDATEKSVTGYTVESISNDLYKEENFSLAENAKAEARGTDAGEYLMGLTALSFVNNSKNFVNVKFVVEDGKLTITRRGSGDMKVTVTARDNKGIIYDGKAHGENGYTTANLVEGHSVKSVVIDGSRIDAGLYEDELVPHDAIIVDAQGNDVTRNYLLTYVAGDLEILKRGIPDDPKNPDDPKRVKIIANDGKAEYDGQAHGENGYTSVNLAEGQSVKSALVSGSKTDAGLYENALLPSDAMIVDAQGNDVTRNYFLTYVAGDLEITRRAATVTASDNKGILYDGKEHGGNGYTSSNLLDGHTVTGVVIDGARIDAGLYEDALVPHDATIVDAQGNDVSANYELTYVAGDLEITPIMDEIVVTITGHKGYFIYDGTRKTLMGYEVEVSDPSYALDNIVFTGWARVHGIEPGVYMMGLKEDQFHDKGNYANVKFIVIDGVMTIVRGKHYVAWLHDTSTMINSAEKSDTLTAISSYLERTKIQTVFHSGNVVADPTSQEQWDAFNDTMKHLYDNERRTFIVNGAAQDVVENSLFLDQPFRKDYLESDMFEEGKGVVDRFEMGGVKMIMVTLGDDAMTEEGLKWARDKFNAESDRVGILMVNTYLTEDKKIAESAEEIEKQIVSVCGNVRLVLSSNAEYNSHESFKYGERTVWALNADIEAATAEGYITLLEFDADTRSLYVTTYSPVKNDFVYDDDKLEYEQFTLYNAF